MILRGPERPDFLRDECLVDLLASTANRQPDQPALIWGQRTVSYAQLLAASQTVGAALQARGATRGKVVGLFLPRGADLLITQAGITQSGAAWLPLDAETPPERIATCLQTAQALGLVTTREWLPRLRGATFPVWAMEDLLAEQPLAFAGCPAKPTDTAYVIFTSGSTGKPKGIAISQRSICHFLRSENSVLGVRPEDRVYQGFSVAFDMSFEEIWISYLVGATLWLAPPPLIGDPELLPQSLTRERITVLHAVPTLLSLVDDPLPTVRLINLGGEACPASLASRLTRPGRRVFNTYGPTETSVSATLAELQPGEPVTIGRPLPNYGLLVVDEQGHPRPMGEMGELCITGPGLAQGYLGRPDLTADRFVANPAAVRPDEAIMYRTGDLARIDPGGPVHCFGRTDNQVKIRGFRVELEEITAKLMAQPGVAAAATVVRPLAETDQIVCFISPAANQQLEPAPLRQALAQQLPPYMVPAHFEMVETLPRLASGKIDLPALRRLHLKTAVAATETEAPQNEDEAALFAALQKLFPGRGWRRTADFFDELGGHSLLAARLVSLLRADARYAALSVQVVYGERRLAEIAQAMQRRRLQPPPAAAPQRVAVSTRRHFLCGLMQAGVIPFFVLLHMADWLAPFFVFHYFTGDAGDSVARAIGYSLGTFVLAQFATFAIAIAGKRLVVGRLQAGHYPLWGATYFRWWLGQQFCELPDNFLLASTPWMPLFLRALGARIGREVMIDTFTLGAPELLTIEDGVSLGTFVNIENARVAGGELILGPVRLKRECVVESNAVLENDTELGEGARLKGQSALAAGRTVPAVEIWAGAPARVAVEPFIEPLPARQKISFIRHWAQAVALLATAFAVAVLFFLPTFPAFMLIDWLDAHSLDVFESHVNPVAAFGFFFLLAIPASALFVGLTMALTAGLRWLLPRQTSGTFSVNSFAFWHKNLMTLILDCSLRVLHGLYASVFAPLWLRCLGAQVGRHAEISTAEGMVPELLSLGDDSFIADSAMLGDGESHAGWMALKPTHVGNRSFIGNGAYVPDGITVPDDVLIGVQTSAPKNEHMQSGQTWMGSPPIRLPAREGLQGFPEALTFRPSRLRRWGRGSVEFLRIVLPLAVVIASGYLIIVLVLPVAEECGWGYQAAGALAGAGCLFGLASFLMVVALKWMFIGRYRPRAAAMWTPFVWISEAITNLYESLAVPNFLDLLRGTPMLPWALRLLGTRVGKRVYLYTTDITEFDCVRIGDDAELNACSGPQTHLFEDRVMKIGLVEIGERVTVGPRSTILYDTRIGDDAVLGPLTLVAKGERLPPSTIWEGSPAAAIPTR